MRQYIARRVMLAVPTLIGVSLITFLIMSILPGDVAIAILGRDATKEKADTLREQLGLNDPWYEQYGRWVRDMVTFGDLGTSLFSEKRPIKQLIGRAFPVTLNLTVFAMVIALVGGISLGTISAIKHNTWVDYVARVISIIGLSIPVFWLGIMIMLFLAYTWRWQASVIWVSPFDDPWVNLQQMFWPALALGYFQVAFIARMTRSCLLEVLLEDYMRTARAKGLQERVVVIRHGMRNAIIPIVTLGALQFVALLSGVVVTERVFNLNGWGMLLWNGVFMRDFPVVQTMIFIFAAIVILVNLFTDILYGWLDPRIRYG